MSLFGDVRKLKAERTRELELLHARIVTIADALECEPAQWVGEHPYIAVAGAAAMGFIAAQLPPRAAARAVAAAPAPAKAPARPSVAAAAPAAPGAARCGEMLELLLDLAMPLLQAGSAGAAESSAAATLMAGNAGSVEGSFFPAGWGATAAGATQ